MYLVTMFLFASSLAASDSIHYRLAMPQPSSHLFVVTIIVDQVTEQAVDFQMPAWSPGRYVIYDFAHNVQEFRAQGDQNQPLLFEKIDKQTWRVHTSGSHRVAIEYKVFANTLSGTFSQLNDQHANYNGASIYMYVVGMKDHPIDLDIEAPEGWAVMNGLPGGKAGGDHWVLQAPNYYILIDCPTEIARFSDSGPMRVKSFSYAGKTFRVVIHNNGSDKNVDRFVSDLEKIVKTEFEVMGPPDFNQYTFLFHFNPYALHGDGMEHLNSTQIVITGNLGDDENYENYLWVSAHEFFHAWNVKRLRPVPLGPWDYAKENYTPSLWISEGITSYYASLSLRRSGLWDDQKYFKHVTGLIEAIQNSYGRFERNVEQASSDTWFWHDTPDASNWQNVFLSYYTQGEILGALLDLELRQRTANAKTLDDVFRTLYKKFYATPGTTYYLQGRAFREEDFLEALNTVSSTDFTDFWKRNIATTAELDYNQYLKAAGLYLDAQHSEAVPYAGISSRENSDHLVVIENVVPETAASHDGLSTGDIILAVDGERVNSKTLGECLKEKKPGEKVRFTVYRENRLLNVDVVLGSREGVTYSIKGLENPTPLQKQIRTSWLGQPSDSKGRNR
jgi:predicted metalloprotease with PDZ domain